MKLSVIVPVFNEEKVIETTHRRVLGILEGLLRRDLIDDYEIIYVDDGSKDATLTFLRNFSGESTRNKVLSFSRNFGHQSALAAGLINSSGDAVVSLDADLQDPPELIETMLEEYRKGHDIVYAVRRDRRTDSVFKRWTARLFYKTMKVMGADTIHDHADYRLVSKRVVEAYRGIKEVNIFLRGIFPYMGFAHALVYYDRQERVAGTTKYPLRKMMAFAWEGITSFSSIPLRLASIVGLAIFLSSVGLIAWAFYVKLIGKAIPGWSSVVIPVLFVGGLNVLLLGLVGEYVGKIYLEVKRRPLFIIKERYNCGDSLFG